MNGTLVYVNNRAREFQYTWFDRAGKEVGKVGETSVRRGGSLSPDGNSIAMSGIMLTSTPSVHLLDLVKNTESRISEKHVLATSPVWSNDETRIIYRSTSRSAGDRGGVVLKDLKNGQEAPVRALDEAPSANPSDWSADGRFLVFTKVDPKTAGDIWYLPDPEKAESKPVLFLGTNANESQGQLSPDGKWLAYVEDEGANSLSISGRFLQVPRRPKLQPSPAIPVGAAMETSCFIWAGTPNRGR